MKTFKEWLSPIKRGRKLTRKDVPHVQDHISHSYLEKEIKDKISFDGDAIYLKKTGKTIITSKQYVNKMDIDSVIKVLRQKVK